MIRRPPRSTRTDTAFPTRRSSDLINGRVIRDDHEGHSCSCSMPSEMLPLGGEHSRAVRLSTAHPSFQHLDCSQTCRRFSIAEVASIGKPAPAAILQKNNLYYLAQIG